MPAPNKFRYFTKPPYKSITIKTKNRDEPNWNCSLSIRRMDAGATRCRATSCKQATPLSKFGKTIDPYLRQSGIGLIFRVTSVTTPSVPANGTVHRKVTHLKG